MQPRDQHTKQQARQLRIKGKSLGAICGLLGLPKTTVYGWIRDMPVPIVDGIDIRTRARSKQTSKSIQLRARACEATWATRREEMYIRGKKEAAAILHNRKLRDFVCLYLAEGDKRSRGTVGIVNTDPAIMRLCAEVLPKFSARKICYRLACASEELAKLRSFWAKTLNVVPESIQFQPKKQIHGRRAEFGLLTIRTADTYFKCRLCAWMDMLRNRWP